MHTEYTRSIIISPISILFNEACYDIEIRGKILPSGKFFTCEVKDRGIFILEAVANPLTKKYNWVTTADNEFAPLVPIIRQEIEKQMKAA